MWCLQDQHPRRNNNILATQTQMRCKIRSFTPFRGKYGYKKENRTDTFVSITVSVMGIDPNFNRILFLGCITALGWGAFCVLGCHMGCNYCGRLDSRNSHKASGSVRSAVTSSPFSSQETSLMLNTRLMCLSTTGSSLLPSRRAYVIMC